MDTVRFLHIPKTAGTSFTDCLARIYPGEEFNFTGFPQDDRERFWAMEASEREKLGLIAGHSPRITGIPEIDRLPTITFLRDPVMRVKSLCQHVSEGKSPDLWERFPPESFSLDEYLRTGGQQLSNVHTRLLLGNGDYELPAGDPETLADRATSVLQDDLACFGIAEEFESSLMLFRYRLDWQQWPVYRPLNVRAKSQLIEFSSAHVARIRELNAIDIKVYENAREVFHKELEKIADYMEDNLPLFRHRQQLWAQPPGAQRSESPAGQHPDKSWGERSAHALHILRTQGFGDLWAEIKQFIEWSRT